MRTTKLIFGIFILSLMAPASVFSQFIKTPSWILYEQGNAFFSIKEYGPALKKYQEALAAFAVFPEAEIGIGDIYLQEGELDLAVKQYKKAYELKNSFYIPEMKYEALYKLAGIYETTQMYKPFEDALKSVILDDKNFNQPSTSRLREQFESNYYGKGLDFVLKVYRFPERFPAEAHSKLGWFYYRSGNYTTSVLHLLYAVVYKISDAGQYVADMDVDFQFTTLGDFLVVVNNDSFLIDYFKTSGVFRDLYYLAGSAFKVGFPAHARMIWQLLSRSSLAGSYADLSARQLRSPWTEPLLVQPVKR